MCSLLQLDNSNCAVVYMHYFPIYSAAALLAMQSAVLAMSIPSVSPFVTLWYPIQKNEGRISQSSLWGSKNTLLFWYQQCLGGDVPFHLKFALKLNWSTHPSEKRRLRPIYAYNVSNVRASEISSIIANRKSTTRFPTSYIWSPYVTPNSPNGWLKKRICRLKTNSLIFP